MQFSKNQDSLSNETRATPSRQPSNYHWTRALACFAVAAALTGAAEPGMDDPGQNTDRPFLLPEANRPLDANQQMEMRDQQTKKQSFEAANAERKKQIADDSARLLKLATDLKVEVDKTNKDTLSLNVIRKADEIEKLAHNAKEKMKLTVGPA